MSEDKFQSELGRLFEREDRVFRADGEAFVARVERKLTQRLWMRRAVLGGAMLAGGLIASLSAPEVLGQMGQFIGLGEAALNDATAGVTGLPMRLSAMLIAAVLSILAVFSTDRV